MCIWFIIILENYYQNDTPQHLSRRYARQCFSTNQAHPLEKLYNTKKNLSTKILNKTTEKTHFQSKK